MRCVRRRGSGMASQVAILRVPRGLCHAELVQAQRMAIGIADMMADGERFTAILPEGYELEFMGAGDIQKCPYCKEWRPSGMVKCGGCGAALGG